MSHELRLGNSWGLLLFSKVWLFTLKLFIYAQSFIYYLLHNICSLQVNENLLAVQVYVMLDGEVHAFHSWKVWYNNFCNNPPPGGFKWQNLEKFSENTPGEFGKSVRDSSYPAFEYLLYSLRVGVIKLPKLSSRFDLFISKVKFLAVFPEILSTVGIWILTIWILETFEYRTFCWS